MKDTQNLTEFIAGAILIVLAGAFALGCTAFLIPYVR